MPAIPSHTLKVYDIAMKYVLLAIFVLLAGQPLQASSCDMDHGQGTNQSQHGSMHEGPMDDDAGSKMDCCDQDSEETSDDCSSMSHCGACGAGLAVVSPSAFNTIFISGSQQYFSAGNEPSSISFSPPFRPPIA